jgi:hypothetical protein
MFFLYIIKYNFINEFSHLLNIKRSLSTFSYISSETAVGIIVHFLAVLISIASQIILAFLSVHRRYQVESWDSADVKSP